MPRSFLTTLSLLSALAGSLSAQQFMRDTSFPAQNVWTDGVETVDVDDDGDIDILFANGSNYGSTGTAGAQDQHLFLNDGAGNFTAAHGQLLHGGNFNAKMVIAEDFDGDGAPDLMYASGSGGAAPRLLLNDGAGHFSNASSNLPSGSLRSFCVVGGDIDDDGDIDVAITDGGTFGGFATQQRLWLNDGSAHFTDVTGTQMPADNFNCQDVTFVDFDGDFDVDLLLMGKGQSGKRGRLYLNDGAGNFSIASAMNQVGSGNTYEGDWSDLDGDGRFDCNVQSISGTSEGWAKNRGTGVAMTESTYPAPNGGDDNEMAQLDYDNDGDMDCFAGSLTSAGEKVWRNNGSGGFTNNNGAIQTITDSTLDFGFADLNGDGRYDMITGQGESGNFTNKIYINNGPVDTLAPDVMAVEFGAAVTAPFSVVHIQVQDAINDDGHVNVDVSFTYTTDDPAAGSGTATRMGNGLYRVAVPTSGSATFADISITITDTAGNATVEDVFIGTSNAWTDVGGGKAGSGGLTPLLVGSGPLTAGSFNTVIMTNALPGSSTNLVIGFSLLNVSFRGGTLVPAADALFLGLPVDGSGSNNIPFIWPAGVTPGTLFWAQHWVSDAAVSFNLSASNGLRGEAQ
ncbi:MAG: hypothetical protein DRQ55_05205 [Planctomycetota bacterium]|nr:MAG: hypothetical protein DRQ55_05205 [Planctomycetota bacterium]